jgi:hypothetical protein
MVGKGKGWEYGRVDRTGWAEPIVTGMLEARYRRWTIIEEGIMGAVERR